MPRLNNKIAYDPIKAKVPGKFTEEYYGFVPFSSEHVSNFKDLPTHDISQSDKAVPATTSITGEPNWALWNSFGHSSVFTTPKRPSTSTTRTHKTTKPRHASDEDISTTPWLNMSGL